jgi:PAS domain S-box-containing protein
MNTLLVAVAARWEDRLRELLARRGHTFSIVDDSGKIGATLEQADYKLAFVGIGEAIGEAVESCRQLRACSGAKPLEILACGASLQSDKIQALLSAGVNDCLIDADNNAELDLRLALAEFRVSRSPASGAIQQPGIAPCDYGNSCDGASKGIFRSSLEGKFLDVSQSVVDMLGYKSREELLQIDLARDLYIDPLMRNQLLSELSAELKTHDILCKRRDGSPIVVRITWRRVFDDAGIFLYFEGTVQDISQSIRSPHLLGIRYNLAFKLSTTFDFQTTLDLILDALIQIEGIDCGGIYLFNDSSQQFELAAAIGIPEWFIQSVSQFPLDLPQTQYIMQGKSFYLPIEESQLINKSLFEREGIKTVAVVPIQHQGRVIATFNLGSRTQTEISLNARRSIEAIAIQVGGNVARAQSSATCKACSNRFKTCVSSSTRQGGSCMPIACSANDRDI